MLANSSAQLSEYDSSPGQLELESTMRNLSFNIVSQYLSMYYICIPIEIIAILTTFAGFLSVITDRKLRCKKTFLIIAVLLFGFFASAFGSLTSIVILLINLKLYGHVVVSNRTCFAISQPYSFGFSLVSDAGFALAVDRSLAIVLPVWYNKEYKEWMLQIQFLIMLAHYGIWTVIASVRLHDRLLPICTPASDNTNTVQVAQMAVKSSLLALTVLVYLVLIIWVKRKLYAVKDNAQLYSKRQRQLKSRLLSTLMICVLIHVATVCAGAIIGCFVMSQVDPSKAMSIAKFGIVTETSGPLNAAFLYARTKELQVSLFNSFSRIARLFGVKMATKVMPTTTHSFGTRCAGSLTEH
uniref:G-protein coupled receptors family 1 profile domain-containing protein n=1 Tax=Trichuris muris TaxID=70415 RepID=A0A5S6R2S8_TRIMR